MKTPVKDGVYISELVPIYKEDETVIHFGIYHKGYTVYKLRVKNNVLEAIQKSLEYDIDKGMNNERKLVIIKITDNIVSDYLDVQYGE